MELLRKMTEMISKMYYGKDVNKSYCDIEKQDYVEDWIDEINASRPREYLNQYELVF